jgi:DnaJ like chaperone protein
MSWWGKLLGGAFGFMLGGPLGALIGAAFGHNFDKGMGRIGEEFAPGAQERVQTVFFTTVFSVMGHIAKADGKVSQSEINLARQIMQPFNLDVRAAKSLSTCSTRASSRTFRSRKCCSSFGKNVIAAAT